MTKFEEKIQRVEQILSRRKGVFSFFALVRRIDSENKFDLLVSADWLNNHDKKCFDFIAKEIKQELSEDEILNISRIILLPQHDPVLTNVKPAMKISNSIVKVENCIINNIMIKEMTIFSSQ